MKSTLLPTIAALLTLTQSLQAQGTAFSYQGKLTDNGNAPTGNYEMRFAIFDAASGGSQLGNPITNSPVAVSDGIFTVILDFGDSIFSGANRWLQIGVRTNGSVGGFTTLSPLQAFTASPYAITASDVTDVNISRLNVPNTATPATGNPTVTSGFITGAAITHSGLGYGVPPTVTVNDTTGSGAVITASVSGGRVVALTVQNPGTGYSSGATLMITPPPSNAFQTFVTPNFFTGVNTMNNPNNTFAGSFTGDGGGLTNVSAATVAGMPVASFWQLGGNSGSTAGLNFLGTTDNQGLELKVNNMRALRLEPNTNGAPNVIAGARVNFVDTGVLGATISGGGAVYYLDNIFTNRVSADFGTIGGGANNTVGGGANFATIDGGAANTIQTGASFSTVGGGGGNLAQTNSQYSTIGGGQNNTVLGSWATVPGGYLNTAAGNFSFAVGAQAGALHDGAFVWADSQNSRFASTANDQFLIRAAGGVGIGLNHPVGALSVATGTGAVTIRNDNNVSDLVMSGGVAPGTLRVRNIMEIWPNDAGNAGGRLDVRGLNGGATISLTGATGNITAVTLTQTSDRNAKENFSAIDPQEVLERVAGLPITRWNFKADAGTAHLGPMAQDFYAAFGVGADEKHIATVDESGVALAALQGLNRKVEEKAAQLRQLEARLERLERLLNTKTESLK